MKFFGGVECLTSNKPLDPGVDPDRDLGPGIFNGILYHCVTEFLCLGRTALAEVCAL